MAKKTKSHRRQAQAQAQRRRVQRAGQQPPSAGAPPPIPVDTPRALTADAVPAVEDVEETVGEAVARPASGSGPAARRVGRLEPGARRAKPGRATVATAALFEPLDPDDAAIPFDRVPYVPADLRRVAVIAALMVVLIVVADLVVSRVVG